MPCFDGNIYLLPEGKRIKKRIMNGESWLEILLEETHTCCIVTFGSRRRDWRWLKTSFVLNHSLHHQELCFSANLQVPVPTYTYVRLDVHIFTFLSRNGPGARSVFGVINFLGWWKIFFDERSFSFFGACSTCESALWASYHLLRRGPRECVLSNWWKGGS